jgi:hypothetical protein
MSIKPNLDPVLGTHAVSSVPSNGRNHTGAMDDNDSIMVQRHKPISQHKVTDYAFTLAATLVASLYVILIFGELLYYSWKPEVISIPQSAWDKPQISIAIFLIFAASFLWLWRGLLGKVLAFLSFVYIFWQFFEWFEATKQVRRIAGNAIRQGGRLDSVFLGASWFDPIALIAVATLLCINLYFLLPKIKRARNTKHAMSTKTEEDNQQAITLAGFVRNRNQRQQAEPNELRQHNVN